MYQIQIHHNGNIVKTFDGQEDKKLVDRAYCWISGHYPGSVWHTMRYEGVRMFKFDLPANAVVELCPTHKYEGGKVAARIITEYVLAPVQNI